MSITRKLAKLILTLLTLPLLVVVWLLKWFVMFLYCCSAWIFYLLGSVLFATVVLSFLMKQSQGMEALQKYSAVPCEPPHLSLSAIDGASPRDVSTFFIGHPAYRRI